jgi:hypothetical protein
MKKLAYNVHVVDEDGNAAVYGPHSESIPDSVRKQITNPSAWVQDDDAVTGDDDGLPPDVVAARQQARGSDGDGDEPKPYAKWLKADLEAEVAKRNEARDADDQIEVGGTGKVKDLAAALVADDAAGDTGDSA